MQNYSPSAAGNNEPAAAMIAFFLAAVLCWIFFSDFVRWSCWSLYWLWRFVDFPQIHRFAAERINLLAATGNQAENVSLSEWINVMNGTAGLLFVLFIPLLIATGSSVASHPALSFRSRRWISVHTLPRVMATFAPSVIPVLANHKADGLMNDTTPENAWAMKPEEFATQKGLVRQRVLDRDAAREAFEEQVGLPMGPIEKWEIQERAMFAIFGLQVFADDRAAALQLLDNLNRSCMVKRLFKTPEFRSIPNWAISERQIARVISCPGVEQWLATHLTVRSALVGLYGRDLRLPPAKFRWLKGIDRTLWYGLQTADTAKVFVEGAGIVAQARAEKQASRLGLPLPPLMAEEAVVGLQMELETLGLVYPRDVRKSKGRRMRDVSFPDAIYLPSQSETDLTPDNSIS